MVTYFKTHYYIAGNPISPVPLNPSIHQHPPPPPPTTVYTSGAAVSHHTQMKRCRQAKPKKEATPEIELDDIEDINFNKQEIQEIRTLLLNWYDENKRDLPWRRISSGNVEEVEREGDCDEVEERERRAYAVWVSEVMLQQTRVQTVVDYFNRWLEKWPTIHHLAHASIEEVNEMWAGLGYYRRARFLLEGAKQIVEGGEFPSTVSSLRKVKGIGDYTAGAIASIAFREAVPLVDGNVIRVIARLKAISANPKEKTTIKNIWKLAGQLVNPLRPGDFNQGLMELGATICSPLKPSCSTCPISHQCQALSLSTDHESIHVTDYPRKVVKAKQRREFSAVSVVEIVDVERSQSDSRFLLVKRPENGLLAGLWEFPSVLLEGEADLATRQKEIDNFLKQSLGVDMKISCKILSREEVGEHVHIFSHICLKMYVELLVLDLKGGKNLLQTKQSSEAMTWKYVDREAISTLGLTSGVRKVYTMIEKFKESKSGAVPTATRMKRNKQK